MSMSQRDTAASFGWQYGFVAVGQPLLAQNSNAAQHSTHLSGFLNFLVKPLLAVLQLCQLCLQVAVLPLLFCCHALKQLNVLSHRMSSVRQIHVLTEIHMHTVSACMTCLDINCN